MAEDRIRRLRQMLEAPLNIFGRFTRSSPTDETPPEPIARDRIVLTTKQGPVTLFLPVGTEPEHVSHMVNASLPCALEVALNTLTPGATCWDLGTHIGTFSVRAAKAGAKVFSVEAGPGNGAALERTIDFNPELSIQLAKTAISDRTGTIGFSENGPFGIVVEQGQILVPMITGDELFDQQSQPRIDLIKIDIEGSEPAALSGMPRALAMTNAVVIESNDHALRLFDSSPQAIVGLLEDAGFTLFRCVGDELAAVTRSDWQPETTIDYLALRDVALAGRPTRGGLGTDELVEIWLNDSLVPVATHQERAVAAIASAPAAVQNSLRVQERLAAMRASTQNP